MSVYLKLNQARLKFHGLKLEKTGHNKFAGYKYFELADFLIPALSVFNEVGLCAVISFDANLATMRIIDIESKDEMAITSPMSSAALKGCHEVQNLGAVQTYLRRYLWVAALEIVEHDAVDSSDGKSKKPKKEFINWVDLIRKSTNIEDLQAHFAEAYKSTNGKLRDQCKAAYDEMKTKIGQKNANHS